MNKFIFTMVLFGAVAAQADICGKEDNRVPSQDSRVARFSDGQSAVGCTLTMISESCGITSGYCADKTVAEFNVPASVEGKPGFSALEDVYEVAEVVGASQGAVGEHFGVVKFHPNAITGKLPGAVQGFYEVESKKSAVGSDVKVISYSMADNDRWEVRQGYVPRNHFASVINRAQSVAVGELVKSGIFLIPEIIEYSVDTTSGSTGAAVINARTNQVIGVVTHGGCAADYGVKLGARYTNSGTSVTGSKAFKKAIAQCKMVR